MIKENQVAVENLDGNLHGVHVKQKATSGGGSALHVDSDHATNPAVLVRGAGPLLDLRDAAGVSRFQVASSGLITGPTTIRPADTSGVALIVKGLASQVTAVLEVQDDAGTVKFRAKVDGSLNATYLDSVAATGPYLELVGTYLRVINRNATHVPLAVQLAASQTGDGFQVLDSTGTALLSVTAAGLPKWNAAANQQTTVGAAGGAAALPATPTKFLKVVDSTGAVLVLAAYAAA